MRVTKLAVRRAVKINTGSYENTDIEVAIEAAVDAGDNVGQAYADLMATADNMVREKVDEIEIGKRRTASKAGRFGL